VAAPHWRSSPSSWSLPNRTLVPLRYSSTRQLRAAVRLAIERLRPTHTAGRRSAAGFFWTSRAHRPLGHLHVLAECAAPAHFHGIPIADLPPPGVDPRCHAIPSGWLVEAAASAPWRSRSAAGLLTLMVRWVVGLARSGEPTPSTPSLRVRETQCPIGYSAFAFRLGLHRPAELPSECCPRC